MKCYKTSKYYSISKFIHYLQNIINNTSNCCYHWFFYFQYWSQNSIWN